MSGDQVLVYVSIKADCVGSGIERVERFKVGTKVPR